MIVTCKQDFHLVEVGEPGIGLKSYLILVYCFISSTLHCSTLKLPMTCFEHHHLIINIFLTNKTHHTSLPHPDYPQPSGQILPWVPPPFPPPVLNSEIKTLGNISLPWFLKLVVTICCLLADKVCRNLIERKQKNIFILFHNWMKKWTIIYSLKVRSNKTFRRSLQS